MRSYPLVLLFAFVVVSREASADDTQDRKQVHAETLLVLWRSLEAMTTEWAVDAVRLQKTQMIDWHKRGITLADFVENTNAAYGPGKINWMNPYFSVFVAFARGFEGPPAKYPHLYLLGELAKKNNGLGHVIEKILSASQPKVAGEPAPIPMHERRDSEFADSFILDLLQEVVMAE
ncbi:RxLR-like protein [Plasmopara halstedii]|uniref:RxLR-like protein n=1 Tax=Plasmopara halstedii TaxID=4781 RepID=A0A0N7L3L8_PLAHL|nr:RxLR-like protein [Plasmopara halstedii]CEG36235.1 RxLR-like protein [Plasmopara halstedii]|eukprot:XP_024572604.1 RxLR-like protein [Plasmopara halstedii]